MTKKLKPFQKKWKRFDKSLSRVFGKNKWQNLGLILGAFILVITLNFWENRRMELNYETLLNTIAEGESKGNYNAYFGNSNNQEIVFTDMTVAEVQQWQRDFVAGGQASNAVGKYQIISPTLDSLVQKLSLDGSEKFTPELQDKMAIKLLEKRGIWQYANGEITREEFAHNLSKEWAALPKVIGDDPSASYYANDGLNRSHISVDKIIAAIETLKNPQNNV